MTTLFEITMHEHTGNTTAEVYTNPHVPAQSVDLVAVYLGQLIAARLEGREVTGTQVTDPDGRGFFSFDPPEVCATRYGDGYQLAAATIAPRVHHIDMSTTALTCEKETQP